MANRERPSPIRPFSPTKCSCSRPVPAVPRGLPLAAGCAVVRPEQLLGILRLLGILGGRPDRCWAF